MHHLDNHKRDIQFLVLSGHICTIQDVFRSDGVLSGACSGECLEAILQNPIIVLVIVYLLQLGKP